MKADNRKATYTDRPLTEEEKAFAADPKNYNLLFWYMRMHKLDQEEWYDILIIPYLNCVKKYHEHGLSERLAFSTVFERKMYTAVTDEYKKRKRKKRMPEGGFCSLDLVIENDNGRERHVEAWLTDRKANVERQVISKESFFEFLDNIEEFFQHEEMKAVLFMLLNGCTKREVIKYCRDRFDNYDPVLPWGIDDYNFIVRQLRSAFKETYGF